MQRRTGVFGSRTKTQVLIATALLGRTYPRELARILDLPLLSVQRAVNALDIEGMLATRLVGKQREVQLNPGYFAKKELAALLFRLGEAEPHLHRVIEGMRRRPRRAGKPLVMVSHKSDAD